MTNLSEIISRFLQTEQVGEKTLLEIIDLSIDDSKGKIRSKLQELVKLKNCPDLESSITDASTLLTQSEDANSEAQEYFDLVEKNILPLLNVQITDLNEKIEYLQVLQQSKKPKVEMVAQTVSQEPVDIYLEQLDAMGDPGPFDHYMSEARTLVCNDLSDVDEITLKEYEIPEDEYDELYEELVDFSSSRFFVSNFMLDFIKLLESVILAMDDAEMSGKLFIVLTKLFSLYVHVTPIRFKKVLDLSPQCSAIYYNNCMYLSYCLDELNEKVTQKFTTSATAVNLLQLRPSLQNLASITLKQQKRQMRLTILDFYQQPQVLQSLIDNTSTKESILMPFEIATRQSLAHLDSIKTNWSTVLSHRIFNKVMGDLLDVMLSEFIQRIVSLEDISARSATNVAQLMDYVMNNWKSVFHELDEDMSGLAPKCFAFTELKFVLLASLKDIVDRWTDGYGPLATAFPADSVKRLIRALFQNNEKRALALSLIK
ncbi:Centromere/kinetochore protein zw10 -like protein [Halotydeus destructor]|nr:Centromere/kinetochore protein zw10 -like protein [Halotydeus destructor]